MKCFCLFKNVETHKIKEIREIKIVECGAAKSNFYNVLEVSLHTRWYGNQFMFSDCSEMTALRCLSE